MIDQQQEPVVDVLAAVVRVEDLEGADGTDSAVLAIVTWSADEPVPFLDAAEAEESLELTTQLVTAIDNNSNFVPEGWEADDVVFAYEALLDGMTALREALPALEELDDAQEVIGGVMEGFMLAELFVPTLTVYDVGDLTEEMPTE